MSNKQELYFHSIRQFVRMMTEAHYVLDSGVSFTTDRHSEKLCYTRAAANENTCFTLKFLPFSATCLIKIREQRRTRNALYCISYIVDKMLGEWP